MMKLHGEEKRIRDEGLVGQQVHNYQLRKLLGHGGWGRVYLASDMKSGREVAIKLLLPELLEQVEVPQGENTTKRFEKEALAAQSLCHANLIQVLDYKETSELGPYIVMEYLPGETLAQRLRQSRPVSRSTMMTLFGQMCEGLSAIHQRGIVYRDLKPSNIYIVPIYGYHLVKLLDFGIALVPESGTLTLKGQLLGTPLYMSPEQIMTPSSVTAQSDIYSFGVLFYRVLTGQPLFMERNPGKLYKLHKQKQKDLSHPKLPTPTVRVLAQILSPTPEHRPGSIHEAWQLLEASMLQTPVKLAALTEDVQAGFEPLEDIPTIPDLYDSAPTPSYEPLST